MVITRRRIVFAVFMSCIVSYLAFGGNVEEQEKLIQVACVGDSITYGARLEDREHDSYPVVLQGLLGAGYNVVNLGVGGCTLIRKGNPNVWKHLDKIREVNPDIIVISLGTNDTCGGNRKCWDHKDEFPDECRYLIDILLALPSQPRVWLCAPSPMVLETPGLSPERRQNLEERKPRLQELIVVLRKIAEEKKIGFIDLNTPLANKPTLFTEEDGVHPNKAGYRAIAELVYAALKKSSEK